MLPQQDQPFNLVKLCPGCEHLPIEHVGGTCYSCWHGYCGWVDLGEGNAWHVEPGWYPGNYLNAIADGMAPEHRPKQRYI